jgi:trans-2-enoyl-CoA reductase
MAEMGLGEGTIQQIDRLFRAKLADPVALDDENRIRVDDWELSDTVQAELNPSLVRCCPPRRCRTLADLSRPTAPNSSSSSALASAALTTASTSIPGW